MTAVLEPQSGAIPLPSPSLRSRPYWEAGARGELLYQRCPHCGHIPPRPILRCGRCAQGEPTWNVSAGTGSLYSWTVVWRPQHPAFTVPYAPAVVSMDEGWWLMSSMIGCRPDQIEAGMPVRVEFHLAGGDVWLPYVRPARL